MNLGSAIGNVWNSFRGNSAEDQATDTAATPGERPELLDLVQKRYSYSRQAKLPLLEKWATCLAFYAGDQWRSWDANQRRLVQPTQIPSWRVLPVYNQLPGITDIAASKLSRARQLPRARPDDENDPADQERAEKGTQAMHAWWHGEEMEILEHESNVNRIILGCSFFHLYWDPSRLAKVPVPDPITGQTKSEYAPVGQACVEVLTPFDVFPEPVENWRDVSWVIVARRRPLSWFRSVFGDAAKGLEAEQGEVESVYSSLIPGTDNSLNVPAPDGEGMATLKTLYERPCKDYPQGRTVMVAGERVLFSQDALPLPFKGLKNPLPVKMLGYRYTPKRLWPKGLIEECISPQRELNRGLGNLSEWLRLHRGPKWMVPKDAKLDAKAITSQPDEVVIYSGPTPPVAVPPAGMPAWLAQYSSTQREELRALSGQEEVSEGGVPSGVSAASAIQLLQQADNVKLNSPALLGKSGLEALAAHVLTVMGERYREPRQMTVPGRQGSQTTATILGEEIGPLEVVVELSEGVEDNDAIRQQQLTEWLAMGLLDIVVTPMGPMLLQMMRDVGLGWMADIIERELPEVQQQMAMQQQEQMLLQAEQQSADQEGQAAERDAAGAEAQAQREHEAQMQQQGQAGGMLTELLRGRNAQQVAATRSQPRGK